MHNMINILRTKCTVLDVEDSRQMQTLKETQKLDLESGELELYQSQNLINWALAKVLSASIL